MERRLQERARRKAGDGRQRKTRNYLRKPRAKKPPVTGPSRYFRRRSAFLPAEHRSGTSRWPAGAPHPTIVTMQDQQIWVTKGDRLSLLGERPAYRPENLAHWTGLRIARFT